MRNSILILIIGLSMFLKPVSSQSSSTFSLGELDPYFEEYLRPLALGIAVGMGHGWAHEAKPHNTLGFDVSVSAVVVSIPEADLMFHSSSLDGMKTNGYSFIDGNSNPITDFELPTVSSDQSTDISIQKDINPNGGTLVDMKALDGVIPYSYAANLAVQLAVGLPKGTEVIGRYLPNMESTINKAANFDQLTVTNFSLWGIGVKHDIKQWIPVVSKVPFLEMSVLLAYSGSRFDSNSSDFSLDLEELIPGVNINYADGVSSEDFNEQGFDMNMNSFNGALLVGFNIPVLKPFVGVGFNKASVNTGMTGNLPFITYVDDDNIDVTIDPVGLRVEADRTFVNLQAGLSMNLAFFSLYGQYTYQEYSMYSAGIAIGFN